MKKELVISAKFDTSDFDKSVDSMQKKLREMYSPADQARQQMLTNQRLQQGGYGGLAGAPDSASYQRTLADNKRVLDRNVREEKTNLEEKAKKLLQEQSIQKKISEQYQATIKAGKEDLKLKHDLLDVQESLNKAQKEYESSHIKVNALLGERQRMDQPGMQNAPGANTIGSGAGGGLNLSAISKAVSGVLAAIATGAAVYDQYTGLPQSRSRSLGTATQGIVGGPLQGIASGDVVGQMAFLPERQAAMKLAADKMHSREITDSVTGMTGIGGIASGTFGTGRAYNSMMSNLTSGAGRYVDHVYGEGTGLGGKLKGLSEEYSSTHQAQLMELAGQDLEANLEAEKRKNPLKNLAAQRLQGNFMQDLATQRQLGLSFETFAGKGGFQESANMAGFNPDLAAGMAGQIMGAGGSTRGGAGNSVLGLQAQRGYDMTNAGAVLGRISGTAGSSQATDAIFKKLLEESVKAGLDKSEFREEQRKFADMTSTILSTSGAKTAEDAQNVLRGFTRFLGKDSTIKDLEGAGGAYQEQQAFSAETGGRGGALQFAAMMNNGLGGLGAMGMASLSEIPEQDINESNPVIVAAAAQMNISPKEVVAKVMASKRQKALSEVGLGADKMKALNEYMQQNNMDESTMTTDQINAMPADIRESYQKEINAPTTRSQYAGTQKRTAVARGLRRGAGDMGGGPQEYGPGTSIEDRLYSPTGRPEDEVVKATGIAAQAMLENFRQFKTEITPAGNALDAFTKKVIAFATALNMIPDKDKAAAQKYMVEGMADNIGPKNQQQAGKPSR